jgi:tRNA(Ile)-lysidine synthase
MNAAVLRQFFVKSGVEPCPLVAAVSGGVDSTALLVALADLRAEGFGVVAAHVNHHLRGAESDGDEAFVRELTGRLGVELHVADGTLDAEAVRDRGVEAAAREVRYARLAAIREEVGARYVVTAHQKNDQAETVLMRLLTGGGIAALRGIHPVREDGVLRPLLEVTRQELEAFLRDRGIVPRFDRSNDDPRFLRNRVRGLVRDLGAVESLAAVAAQARQQWPVLERAIDAAERVHAEAGEGETRFLSMPEEPWLRQALLHRHIRRLDRSARDVSARDLERLATEADRIRRVSVTKTLELVRSGGQLVLRRIPSPAADIGFEIALTPEEPAFLPELGVTVHVAPAAAPESIAALAAGGGRQLVQLPGGAAPAFTVRNRRAGDRFQPLGLAGPKKLKDFLIDRKIAAEVRDRLPLLLWNDEIVWVAGVEVSERFKVTSPQGVLYEVWLEGPGAAEDDRDRSGIQG